jgi:hypothetical protein
MIVMMVQYVGSNEDVRHKETTHPNQTKPNQTKPN